MQRPRGALAWGPGRSAGIIRRWDLRGEGGGQGLPPPISEKRCFLLASGHPGRCFRRVPPEPPGHNKTCSGPPVTEGLCRVWEARIKKRLLSFQKQCKNFKSFLYSDFLQPEGNFLKARFLVFLFLWALLGMTGLHLQEALGSHAFIGEVKEAENIPGGLQQGGNGPYNPLSFRNVYLEWNEAGFFAGKIFKGQPPGIAEDLNPPLFFAQGVWGGTQTDDRFTLLAEGETATSEASRKDSGRPQRDWKGIGRDTAFFLGYQVVFAGILYFLPESVTAWTDEQKDATVKKWWENVQHPVWDEDKFWINYIAHPYFGATYYIRARERGFGEFGSFCYSALLSALYEFGIEAFFEPPSYNDLIATPVGGYLLGKFVFEPLRDKIKAKPELKWYDHAGLILTDPLGALNSVFERLFGIQSEIRVQLHAPDPGRQMTVDPSNGRSIKWQEAKFSGRQGVNLQLHLDW